MALATRDLIVVGAGFALGVGSVAALAFDAWSGGVSQAALSLGVASGLGAGGVVGLLAYRCRRSERLARLYVERLANQAFDVLPNIPAESSWNASLQKLRGLCEGAQSRVLQAEHSRAALEVRHRRFESEHERLRGILAAVAEPVLAVDSYDGILLANRSAERVLGLDTKQIEGRTLQQIERCERLVGLLRDTQRRKSPSSRTEEILIEEAEGETRWFAATATTLIRRAEGEGPAESEGVVAVLRDITHQKQIQKQHAEFVSSASHEMKAPLAGIKAYVELLADGDAEDEATREEFLKVINSQTDRLQRLVENLLNIARIEAGVVNVSKQPLGINELLQEAYNVVQPAAEAKQIELTQYLSPLFLSALVDRDMLLQAAINLLSNAIKYTPSQGRVTLRSRMLDKEVQFEVEDTGVGLSEEDSVRVFEKFYRVAKDQSMAAGTGLGLPLAKHIVEDVHGGRLTVRSQLGKGSTFIVTIPIAGRSNSA